MLVLAFICSTILVVLQGMAVVLDEDGDNNRVTQFVSTILIIIPWMYIFTQLF